MAIINHLCSVIQNIYTLRSMRRVPSSEERCIGGCRLSRDCGVEVSYGDATFRIRDRGLYRLDISPAVERSLRVFRGQGFLVATGEEQRLRAGQVSVVANGSSQITRFDPSERDDLDEWNEKRSAAIATLNKLGKRSLRSRFRRGRGRLLPVGGRATGMRRRR